MSWLFGSVVCLSVSPRSEHRPLTRRMSAPGLTSEAQLRYLLQWFGEFSELQREDFLPILAAARGDRPDLLAASMANLRCEDKPVSLFQCRIKLFNEWFPSWTEDVQDRLVKGVSDADAEFGTKLQDLIKNGPQLNGENGTNELHSLVEEVANEVPETVETVEASQETPEQPIIQDTVPVEIAAAS